MPTPCAFVQIDFEAAFCERLSVADAPSLRPVGLVVPRPEADYYGRVGGPDECEVREFAGEEVLRRHPPDCHIVAFHARQARNRMLRGGEGPLRIKYDLRGGVARNFLCLFLGRDSCDYAIAVPAFRKPLVGYSARYVLKNPGTVLLCIVGDAVQYLP